MQVPFLNLKALHAPLIEELSQAYQSHLQKGDFILGEAVSQFESHFAQWVGPNFHVSGCANGTDAITLAAQALDLPKGSEAIVPAMTYYATVSALLQAGLKVRLVDVTADTWLMDLSEVAQEATEHCSLIVPVHLYGQMCPMDEVHALAEQLDLKVLEDAAQSHGATWKGKPVGEWSDIASFSFYPGKNLGALGDGGAILSKSAALIDKIKKIRNHGSLKKYEHESLGFNSRLDTIQASALEIKLKHINQWNTRRREVAAAYREMLSGVHGLSLPYEHPEARHVYHLYVVQVEDRKGLMEYLKKNEIDCGIHYPKAIHEHQAFKGLFDGASFPEAEHLARHGVSLPMCPTLTDAQVELVAKTVRRFF